MLLKVDRFRLLIEVAKNMKAVTKKEIKKFGNVTGEKGAAAGAGALEGVKARVGAGAEAAVVAVVAEAGALEGQKRINK
jgi:ribosome maturation protein Sdo1